MSVAKIDGPQLLTHSRLACYRACPRRHYLRYELGLRRPTEDHPIRIGSAFARAVEAQAKGLDVWDAISTGLEDPFDVAVATEMFLGHEVRWEHEPLEHVAAELEFDLPLVNPDTGRASPTWRLAGKIDRIVRLADGRLALMEYKTTSRNFAPGEDYWSRLHLDMQLSIYLIAARALGYECATILYDVTRRPALRPLDATPPASRKYKADGKLYASQRETAETLDEYRTRVASSIAEQPDRHFSRIEIARLDQDLDETRAEIWQQQGALREAQKSGRWYRNPDSCFGHGYSCDYVPVCQMRDLETRTPDGFVRVDEIHGELPGHATTGAIPSKPGPG